MPVYEEQLLVALSQAIRGRRDVLRISQHELAQRSGLHRSYIGDIERGARSISIRNLSRLAAALDLTTSKLIALAERDMVQASQHD